MRLETLGEHVANPIVFKGPDLKPFLAPRGVLLNDKIFGVCDTGQNRVLIWKNPAEGFSREPDLILGQSDGAATSRNQGDVASASTLLYPTSIWCEGDKIIVADAWNHRVLIWNHFPEVNGAAADVVIGQPDFENNQPNVEGMGKAPSAQSLNWPYGIFCDGQRLWIADTGNRRVLVYNSIPEQSYQSADHVIGKPSFEERDYESDDPIWPYSVKISSKGELLIADTQFFRVLYWKNWKDALSSKAEIVFGQNDLKQSGQNQFLLQPNERCLNWVYDSCFYKNGILINDTGNSRILFFDQIPDHNNSEAQLVIGRPDFNTSSEYSQTLMGTEKAIYWPFSIGVMGQKLVIADTGNHRIVVADLKF